MPADDCPSFHCRPSTTSTFFPPSFSTRQKPTTGTNDFGSAPTVSPERSMVVGGAARPGTASAAKAIADTSATLVFMLMLMIGLLQEQRATGRGRLAAPPPGERNQQRQDAEKPRQCRICARNQRIAGIIRPLCRFGRLPSCQGVQQREDLTWAG